MKIHEYQAKELLARAAGAIPRGLVASSPAEGQQAFDHLGGPVVPKAQVHDGRATDFSPSRVLARHERPRV